MNYLAKKSHWSNTMKRIISEGEVIDLPEEVGGTQPDLYIKNEKTGKPSKDDLIEKALDAKLGTEEELKGMSYSDLSSLLKN